MAIRHLVALARQSHRPCQLLRAFSTSATVARPPLALPHILFFESEEKIREPKFVKYNSPYVHLHDHTPILSAPLTRVTTLPNGLRVATESNTCSKTATVGVWIDAGSRHESHGTAHFLQQMIMRQLKEEIENMGGCLNSYTSREHTTYYANVLDQNVPQSLDLLSHFLQNPDFDDIKIEQERHVILRQIEEVDGHTEKVFFDHLHSTAFQNSSLGRTILGPAEKVKTITKEDLRNYMSTHYTAPRMVIVGTGAVKHEEIVEQVKSIFTKLLQGSNTTSELVAKEPAGFTGSEFRNIDEDVRIAQFAVAFKGPSWTDPDSIALMVIQEMLGSYTKHTRSSDVAKYKMSRLVRRLDYDNMAYRSRLVRRIDNDNMAESMLTFNTNYKDTGLFGVYATAKPDRLEVLAHTIMLELNGLFYTVPQRNLILARDQLKSSLLLRMDGTGPVAEDIGRQLLTYRRRIPYAELFARIDAVDYKTIMRVVNRFILDKDIAIAAVGPIQGLPEYKWFRRNTYRYRC